MTASGWMTWIALDWACLIVSPLADDLGRAIGRLAVQACKAAALREEKRQRLARLQFEFACEHYRAMHRPASASFGLAQHRGPPWRAGGVIRPGPP